MPFLLALATDVDRRVVVASLRSAADQRVRVARRAAGDVAADKRAGKDVRSSAVKLAGLLDEANTLTEVADELEAAADVPFVLPHNGAIPPPADVAARLVGLQVVGDEVIPIPETDDGTSPEAQAAAELAGLAPDLDAVEDELGALPEDVPAVPETVL